MSGTLTFQWHTFRGEGHINYRYLCCHLGLENYNSIVNFYIFYPIKLVMRKAW